MSATAWRLPALWAVGGGLAGYLAIASASVGASPSEPGVLEGARPLPIRVLVSTPAGRAYEAGRRADNGQYYR